MAKNQQAVPGAGFKEAHIEADGFKIRYMEAGNGDAVVCVHGAGGLRLSGTHDLLAENYHVIAVELPGFGTSPENTQSETIQQLAETVCKAATALGIEKYNVIGNSFGGKVALWMAIEGGGSIPAVVLVAPAAIRTDDVAPPPVEDPEAMRHLLFAYPDKQPELPTPPPDIRKKQTELVMRLIGPSRDKPFEAKLAELETPVLALFGTRDKLVPPAFAHFYSEILPACRLVMVYDAAHALDEDRPEAVNSVVQDFLERHERFLVKTESEVIHP